MRTNSKYPKIALFGRPNVGKSTLFNCLTGKKTALTSLTPGTTRDANAGQAHWQGKILEIIDTGGILEPKYLNEEKKSDKKETYPLLDRLIQKKAKKIISESDLVVFMVDVRDGILPADKEMAEFLKRTFERSSRRQKIILAANKADKPALRAQAAEFNRLGLAEPLAVSAATGSGTGDLLDEIIKKLPDPSFMEPDRKEEPLIINTAIIGKPNAGKSSLINSLLGEEKIIVSPEPHTTREPNDTLIEYEGSKINLIDTAGISKKGQKSAKKKQEKEALHRLSIQKSLKTLKRAEIALLIIDIKEGLSQQEAKLVQEIIENKTSFAVIANKWDLIGAKDIKKYTREIRSRLPFAAYAPIHFCSALTGSKIKKIFDMIREISQARKTEISENALARFLNNAVKKHSPVKSKGTKKPYIRGIKQEKSDPPVFSVRIGAKETLLESYLKYLENRLREKFGFLGTPITMYVVKNKRIHGKQELKKKTRKNKPRK